MTSPRVLLSGGGTGGHIFPAVSIAQEIQKDFRMQSSCLSELWERWKWKKFHRPDLKLKDWILQVSTEVIFYQTLNCHSDY